MHRLGRLRNATIGIAGMISAGIIGCTPTTPPPLSVRPPVSPPPAASQSAPATTAVADPVIASVGATQIRNAELQQPLLEAYGLNMLMLIVQRDMARDACRQQGITVTDQEIKKEYDWTLQQMFPTATDDREKLLDQFLAQPKPHDQMATRAEFAIIIDTNIHLRKLAEPALKNAITDEVLRQEFDEAYGTSVKVRHIVLANPKDAVEIRRRLDAGQDFATLARQFSLNEKTKPLGGELPPFTANSSKVPENFRKVAFGLKVGEVSDPVQADGAYHLIKLEQRIDNKAVKFEDVKDSLRQDLQDRVVIEGVKEVRSRLAKQALAQLNVTDPILKSEFEKRMQNRESMIRDRGKIRQEMEKERATTVPSPATTTAATTTSATMPTTSSTNQTQPSATVPVIRPTSTTASATTEGASSAPPVPVAPPATAPATSPPTVQPTPPTTQAPLPPAPSPPAPATTAPATLPALQSAPAPLTAPASNQASKPATRP